MSTSPARSLPIIAVVFIVTLAIYLLTLTQYHLQDAVEFSESVERGEPPDLFHPLHLLYNPLGLVCYRTALVLPMGELRALPVLQIVNALVGAAGVALCFALLRRLTQDTTASLIGAAFVAFGYGYWYFSTEVETYVITIFLLTLSLWRAVALRERPTTARAILLGACWALAVLFHVTSVLFLIVCATAALTAATDLRRRFVALGIVLATAAVGVAGPYLAAAILVHGCRSVTEIGHWALRLFGSGLVSPLTAASLPPRLAIGLGRSFLGGCYALAVPAVSEAITQMFAGRAVHEDVFLVRHLTRVEVLIAAASTAAALASFVAIVVQALRRRAALQGRYGGGALLCAAWFASYFLFFMWYSPENIEFWPLLAMPLGCLVAMAVSAARGHVVGWALVGALFVTNLVGSILPGCNEANSWPMARVRKYEAAVGDHAAIVIEGGLTEYHLRYFYPGRGVPLESILRKHKDRVDDGFRALHDAVAAARHDGYRVYVSTFALDPVLTRPLQRLYGVSPEMLRERFFARYTFGEPRAGGVAGESLFELLE